MDFMKYALIESEKAMEAEEIPVGAIVVKDGIIIGRGYNQKEKKSNPTEHAEIIAIREACSNIGDWRLNGCEMYVTLNKDMGACGSVVNLVDNRRLNSFVNVIWTYDERCSDILKNFFHLKRNGILQKRRL